MDPSARIRNCLDELKELMTFMLETDEACSGGDATLIASTLDKTNVLEATVAYLTRLKASGGLLATPSRTYAHQFRAGFAACAVEVDRFVESDNGCIGGGMSPDAAFVMAGRLRSSLDRVSRLPAVSLTSHVFDNPTTDWTNRNVSV